MFDFILNEIETMVVNGLKYDSTTIGNKYWRVETLVKYSKHLPIFNLDLKKVDLNQSYDEHSNGTKTMMDIISHCRRILDADLKYPIIIGEDGDIMDGWHRVMKAVLFGKRYVKAVKFDKNPPPDKILK